MEAIACYKTQFNSPDTSEPQTYISTPQFTDAVIARALLFGKRIGVQFGEGFISEKAVGISAFDAIIQNAN
jgi:hypothetical protein